MSRRIEIQVQRIHTGAAVSHIEALLHVVHAFAGEKHERVAIHINAADDYCNLSVDSDHPRKMWRAVSAAIAGDPALLSWVTHRWIVVLEGKLGWNDYLLLAHYDPATRLDALA